MPRGGYRPGAGRKPKYSAEGSTARANDPVVGEKVIARALARATGGDISPEDLSYVRTLGDLQHALGQKSVELIRQVLQNQDRLFQALLDLAGGVTVERANADGETIRVYKEPPDRHAATWLLEMAHGKPTTRTEKKVDTTITVKTTIPRPALAALKELPEGEIIDVAAEVEG